MRALLILRDLNGFVPISQQMVLVKSGKRPGWAIFILFYMISLVKKSKNINKRNLIRGNWWAHSFCTLEQRKQVKFLAASLNDLQSNILLLALSNFSEASYDKPVTIILESTSFPYYLDMIGSRTKQAQQKHWLTNDNLHIFPFFPCKKEHTEWRQKS